MINFFRKKIIVRFPPSPTGLLHVGSVRTALYNFLFARQNGGKFLLRIEDTDKERSKSEYEKNIYDSLSWLGINFDGEVLKSSNRTEIYKKYLDKLINSGVAYVSKETEGTNKEVIRFRNPGIKIKFTDLIRGEVEMDTKELGDFIIARNINEPLYHLAVTVDDFESKITHIIRGEDHIPNTPRQIILLEALGGKRPIYAHLPLVLAPDRSKLSKRKHGESVSLDFYRKEGYLPETIINFLALLGWNPGDDREIFSLDELIKEFSFEKIQKSGAIFDVKKLDWMNGEYIRKKSVKELIKLAQPFLNQFSEVESAKIENIIKLEQPRLKKLSEFTKNIDFFFAEPNYDKNLLLWKKMNDIETKSSLEFAKNILETIGEKDFNKEKLENILLAKAEEIGDRGRLLWPLRVALSGRKASPGPFEIMEILGKTETFERIQKALNMLK